MKTNLLHALLLTFVVTAMSAKSTQLTNAPIVRTASVAADRDAA